jgi:hypothetical protein
MRKIVKIDRRPNRSIALPSVTILGDGFGSPFFMCGRSMENFGEGLKEKFKKFKKFVGFRLKKRNSNFFGIRNDFHFISIPFDFYV